MKEKPYLKKDTTYNKYLLFKGTKFTTLYKFIYHENSAVKIPVLNENKFKIAEHLNIVYIIR